MPSAQRIGLLGTGIFFYLSMEGVAFLASKIIEESFISFSVSPATTIMVSGYTALATALLVFFFAKNKVLGSSLESTESIKKLFLFSVLFYLGTQALGFVSTVIPELIFDSDYLTRKMAFQTYTVENWSFNGIAVTIPVLVVKYGVIVFVVLKELKPKFGTDI